MRKVLFFTALSLSLAGSPILTGAAMAQQLRPGGQVQGELARGDDRLESGEFTDVYEIQGRAGETLRATMRSDEFDTYLMIRGPGGFSEDNDDADGDGTNSALDVRLPANGTYRISATSYEPGESGRYVLRLDGAGQRGPGGLGGGQANAGGGALRLDGTSGGALAQGDRRLTSGEFADDWTLPVRRGETYTVSLSSSEFDTYLMLRGGGLSDDNDDDTGQRGTTNSRLTFTATADGEVGIAATSFQPGEVGRYQIAVERDGMGARADQGRRPQPDFRPSGREADGLIQVPGTGRPAAGKRRVHQHLDAARSARTDRGSALDLLGVRSLPGHPGTRRPVGLQRR
jgi:hypothetical protein